MISVSEALDALFALANPLDIETVAPSDAAGRVLAVPAVAERDQPPFPASAMDGYALNSAGAIKGATYQVIGESAAGHGYNAPVPTGACVRIFTGAPVPSGCDRIIIQEDVDRSGDKITLKDNLDPKYYVRAKGFDFDCGQTFDAPKLLGPNDVALLAAMNVPQVQRRVPPIRSLVNQRRDMDIMRPFPQGHVCAFLQVRLFQTAVIVSSFKRMLSAAGTQLP